MAMLLAVVAPCGLAASRSNEGDCGSAFASFLASPTEKSFFTLRNTKGGACGQKLDSLDEIFEHVVKLTAKGNWWAAMYLGENLHYFDGGNLEDALVALGEFADRDMTRFVLMLHDGHIERQGFVNALQTSPESLTDDFDGQLKSFIQRKRLLLQVNQRSLFAERRLGLDVVSGAIDEAKRSQLNNPERRD